jgi:hypothetical protein
VSTYRVIRTVHHTVRDGRLCTARIEHQVVEVISAGPCRTPVPVRAGTEVVLVDCGRRRPAWEQCPACQTQVEVVEVRRHVDGGEQGKAGVTGTEMVHQ